MTKQRLALAFIIAAGAALRFYHLGADSLWLDEAGVAYAARAGDLAGMLQVVRSHVLAMPLDYLVVWLVGKISLSEGVLRIPAALWGTLSLLLAYLLFRRLASDRAALFGTLLLALSPLHVQYSQELRFYASLVFFYLLSTWLLWRALEDPTPFRWVTAALVTALGIYFHPYVILALANGLAWLVLSGWQGETARRKRIAFLLASTLLLLAFLVGYRTFSASNPFRIPLMVFEESPLASLASGLGWLPFSPGHPGWHWLYGGLFALLQIAGVVLSLRRGWRTPLAGFFYALTAQFIAIFGMDLLGHYFFAPRQLLTLLPGLCLFAGVGASALVDALHLRVPGRSYARASAVIVALLLILTSLPALAYYDRDDKGDSRALVSEIVRGWQPGSLALVVPGYEGFVYKYYAQYSYLRPDIGDQTYAAEWEELPQAAKTATGPVFLVTNQRLSAGQADQLADLGFQKVMQSYPFSRYAKTLWLRPGSN